MPSPIAIAVAPMTGGCAHTPTLRRIAKAKEVWNSSTGKWVNMYSHIMAHD